MSLANMMNDTIELLKSDGTKKTGLKASVQRSKVFMDFDDILVEPSDLIIRRMSNGAEETYRAIDPGFHGLDVNLTRESRAVVKCDGPLGMRLKVGSPRRRT